MATTEEELQGKRDYAQQLREQIANAQSEKQQNEALLANELASAQLDTEIAQLEAALHAAQASSDPERAIAGVSDLLDSVNANKQAAVDALEYAKTGTSPDVPSDAVEVADPAPVSAVTPTPTTTVPTATPVTTSSTSRVAPVAPSSTEIKE